uniref:OSJNBb0015C06.6 protein n=1 Tax=Oryza sativa subsp. japonica TaxID=39947 RepID=Q7XRZ0_ORYSJ|nr:OSJNBb0015C06.6 [Oryza sativa Japonica Group]
MGRRRSGPLFLSLSVGLIGGSQIWGGGGQGGGLVAAMCGGSGGQGSIGDEDGIKEEFEMEIAPETEKGSAEVRIGCNQDRQSLSWTRDMFGQKSAAKTYGSSKDGEVQQVPAGTTESGGKGAVEGSGDKGDGSQGVQVEDLSPDGNITQLQFNNFQNRIDYAVQHALINQSGVLVNTLSNMVKSIVDGSIAEYQATGPVYLPGVIFPNYRPLVPNSQPSTSNMPPAQPTAPPTVDLVQQQPIQQTPLRQQISQPIQQQSSLNASARFRTPDNQPRQHVVTQVLHNVQPDQSVIAQVIPEHLRFAEAKKNFKKINHVYPYMYGSDDDDDSEVAAAEWIRSKKVIPYQWVKSSGKEEMYDFDITKADKIFDPLLREKQIKLPAGHIIPSSEELGKRRYCKWHNSGSHSTNNCKVFRQQIQTAIEGGKIKFDDSKKPMKVDGNPFPVNMDCEFFRFCWNEGMRLPSIEDCPGCSNIVESSSQSYNRSNRLRQTRVPVHQRLGPVNQDRDQEDDEGRKTQWCPSSIFTKNQKRRVQRLRNREHFQEVEQEINHRLQKTKPSQLKMENPSCYFEGVVEGSNVYTKDTVDDLDDKQGQGFMSADDLEEVDISPGDRPRPTFIIPIIKKNGKVSVCIDFRDLNKATPKDEYPMPVADQLVDAASGHKILNFMDGNAGYNQIFMAEEDIHKTAFRCPGAIGLFEWVVMTFGLKSAGATYQRAMNYIYHDLIGWLVEVYIDDVVVKSMKIEDHIADLMKVFERIRKYGLKMNPTKCAFGVSVGQFLGFLVHERGIEITQRSINAIKKIQPPEDKTELQEMIGKINFVRRFISNLFGRLEPFTPLLRLKADLKFTWGAEQQKALDSIKEYLSSPPVLTISIGRQLAGEYECKNDTLMVYNEKCRELMKGFRLVTLKHVSREQNVEANDLAQGASGYKPMNKDVKVEIATLTADDWRYDVHHYLQNPSQSASQKLRYKALKYTLLDDELYYRTIDGVLLKCLSADQAKVAIGEGCQDCQKFGAIQRAPASAMNPIIKPWPFRGWGIDMIDCRSIVVYRMACHGSIQVPPYKLVYGHEAVVPWVVRIGSRRTELQNELTADEYYNIMTDEREDLVQSRLRALAKVTKDKERVSQHDNKKVVAKSFSKGELVWN